MTGLFFKILNMSISAGWMILAILLLRLLLKNAPKWVRVCLWGLAGLRLLLPFSIQSVFSLIPSGETVSPDIMLDATPQVHTGISALNQAINPVIESSFAPTPLASANPLQIWFPIFTVIWVIGMVCMAGYGILSFWWLRQSVRTAVPFEKHIYQCETVSSPFILGIFRPRIYLPFHMEEQEISAIVAHEKAHISRKDHWWKPLGFGLLALYWFHPLVWLAYVLLCRDIELACDEKVIGKLGSKERADYSQVLLSFSVSQRRIAACPLAFGEVGVKRRIKSILHYKKPAFWVLAAAMVTLMVAAVCFLTDPLVKENYLRMTGERSVSGQEEIIRYELNRSSQPMNAAVFIETWTKGEGNCYPKILLSEEAEEIQIEMKVRQENGKYTGPVIKVQTDPESPNQTGHLNFPEEYEIRGWSFTGYELNKKIPIKAESDKILAVMAFDTGNGVRTVDCENLIEEPERLKKADYMVVVRISFTEGEDGYYPVSHPLSRPVTLGWSLPNYEQTEEQPVMVPTTANLYGVFDSYLYLPYEGATYRYERTEMDVEAVTPVELLESFTESADPKDVPWEIYSVAEYPDRSVVLAFAEEDYKCLYQYSPSKHSESGVLEVAKATGGLVMEDGDVTSGKDAWRYFVETTNAGNAETINFAHYYTLDQEGCSEQYYEAYKEDYPVLYYFNLTYDGNDYTLSWKEGEKEHVRTYQYLMHYTGETPTSTATYDTYERYVLTNDDTLTWDQIQRGMFSSQFGDYIDHYTVYVDLQ